MMMNFIELDLKKNNYEVTEYPNPNYHKLTINENIVDIINYNYKKGNFYIYEVIEQLLEIININDLHKELNNIKEICCRELNLNDDLEIEND